MTAENNESKETTNQEEINHEYTSPIIEILEEGSRPDQSTICQHCPDSIWFISSPNSARLKCYCKAMNVITYDSQEQEIEPVIECDGQEKAIMAMLAAQEEI